MKISIIGSRSIDTQEAKEYIKNILISLNPTQIITGGNTQGVGKIAKELSQEFQIELIEIQPDYKKYGRYAPIKRNDEIIREADYVLAVWDSQSKGTENEIRIAKKYQKPIALKIIKKDTSQLNLF